MEEEYEQIDKIINKVMSKHGTNIGNPLSTWLREVATAALNEGHAVGYDSGYEAGYDIGYCEGAGVTDLKAKYGRE